MLPVPEDALAPLYHAARKAAERAYAPYSGLRVGAALLLHDHSIVTGCNVENASYSLTVCAERSALVRAVSERGAGFRIVAVAVANRDGAESAPCGACRQVLAEFTEPEAPVVFPREGGQPGAPVLFRELFPFAFVLDPPQRYVP